MTFDLAHVHHLEETEHEKMSVVRFLLHRFLRRGKAINQPVDKLLWEGPLLKLLVYSGAISPVASRGTHPAHGIRDSLDPDEQHTAPHDYLLTWLEPCFQTIRFPPPFSLVYDTTGPVLGGDDGVGSLLDWDGLLWAVPKKRTSHSKKRMRMAHKYLKSKGHYTVCPNCQNLKLLHVLCGHCLKEALRQTAKMRRAQIEQKLSSSGWGDGAAESDDVGEGGDHEQQTSTSGTAAR